MEGTLRSDITSRRAAANMRDKDASRSGSYRDRLFKDRFMARTLFQEGAREGVILAHVICHASDIGNIKETT